MSAVCGHRQHAAARHRSSTEAQGHTSGLEQQLNLCFTHAAWQLSLWVSCHGEEQNCTLFSHFRSSFFLPRSYTRRSFPTPIRTRPWKGAMAAGTSSTGVWRELEEEDCEMPSTELISHQAPQNIQANGSPEACWPVPRLITILLYRWGKRSVLCRPLDTSTKHTWC